MKMLDLSKFEKVKEDKHTATMRHKDGHEMTILIAKLPKIHREQLKRLKMADGGVAHYYKGAGPVSVTDISDEQDNPAEDTQIPAQAPVGSAQQLAQAPVDVNVPVLKASSNNLNPNGTFNPTAIARNSQLSEEDKAQINKAAGEAQVKLQQQKIDAEANQSKIDQQNLADVRGNLNNFAEYVRKNPINENAYLENRTGGRKVANAIGLILGGMSGGINGTGVNPVLNYINQQIENNIQGQKERMGQQKTIYGAYHKLYGDSVATSNMAKASMLEIAKMKSDQISLKLNTPQAEQAKVALQTKIALEQSKLMQDAAVDLRNLPGYNHEGSSKIIPNGVKAPSGASASWGEDKNNYSVNKNDYLLDDRHREIYSNLKYDHTHTPKEINDYEEQFKNADQVDKAVKTINEDYPELIKNRTWGGYVSSKAPLIGGLVGAGIEGAGLLGAGPTGGLSLLGGALGAGAAGAGTAAGVNQVGSMMGGQQQIKYETLANEKLLPIITGALTRLGGMTPSAAHEAALGMLPTKMDSDENAQLKMDSLKEKLRKLTPTTALEAFKRTR